MSVRSKTARHGALTRMVALVGSLTLLAVVAVAAPRPVAAASDVQLHSYIRSVYLDLFGREPDLTGLNTWMSALRTGTPRVAVANAITNSREFRTGLITDTYQRYLGRGPDPSGLQNWLTQMDRGATISQISAGFIASDEYYSRNGGQPGAWVAAMYRDVLGRGAAPAEANAWAGQLGHAGVTRTSVSMGILLSEEHLAPVVEGYYNQLLGRGLDPTGRRNWISQLQAGTHDEDIIGGIVASEEYWYISTAPLPAAPEPPPPPAPVPVRIALDWPSGTLDVGTHLNFGVKAVDAQDSVVRDVAAEATLTITGGGTCAGSACWTQTPGYYSVTASWGGFTQTLSNFYIYPGPAVSSKVTVAGLVAPGGNLPTGVSPVVTTSSVDALGNTYDATNQTTVTIDGVVCAPRCGPVTAGSHSIRVEPKVGFNGVALVQTTVPFVGKPPTVAGKRLFHGNVGSTNDGKPIWTPPTQSGTESSWASLSQGWGTTVIRRSDSSLWYWDRGQTGQPLTWVPGTGTSWAPSSVFGMAGHYYGAFSPGGLKGWGAAAPGELGMGADVGSVDTPTNVAVPAGKNWKLVVGDVGYTMALTDGGELWAWGSGAAGTLIWGAPVPAEPVPARVGTETWLSVAAGFRTAIGVRSDGTLWRWDETGSATPTQIGTGTTWASVDEDSRSAGALTTSGELWLWYEEEPGLPTPVKVANPATWSKVAVGVHRGAGIATDGTLWVWDASATATVVPEQLSAQNGWTDVEAADEDIYALRP